MHWRDRAPSDVRVSGGGALVSVCVHLRLTVPWLFELGIIEKY